MADDSPVGGELKEKRDVSDQASVAVLEETRRQALASLSSATYARKTLLIYGQPALEQIRASATPAIADTFHMFLLSLYDSLAQAAAPPQAVIPPHLLQDRVQEKIPLVARTILRRTAHGVCLLRRFL